MMHLLGRPNYNNGECLNRDRLLHKLTIHNCARLYIIMRYR